VVRFFRGLRQYLHAADLIVQTLRGRHISPGDDELAVPLLSLYVNALEFSLKFTIERLNEHRTAGTCTAIATPPPDFQRSVYGGHDLLELVAILEQMLPTEGALHALPGFKEAADFVRELYAFGVTSESTRYTSDRKGVPMELHKKQTWILPAALHGAIDALCKSLEQYVRGDQLLLCGTKDFSRRRLDELLLAQQTMDKLASAFQANGNSDLYEVIENLEDGHLPPLAMGLYFTRPPATIEDLEYFRQWQPERLREKVMERAHLFSEAVAGLQTYIKEVHERMDQKRSSS
jgi:hypothetical protein